MILKKKVPLKKLEPAPVEDKKSKKKSTTTEKKPAKDSPASKYPDKYESVLPDVIVDYNDIKHLVLQVKRGGPDGTLGVDIRWFMTTDSYMGFSSKGITIPIEVFRSLLWELNNVNDALQENNLYSEV
jgi:hypothetical protein